MSRRRSAAAGPRTGDPSRGGPGTQPLSMFLAAISLLFLTLGVGPKTSSGLRTWLRARYTLSTISAGGESVREELTRLQDQKGLALASVHHKKVYVVDFATGTVRAVRTFVKEGAADLGWLSPDGAQIAFSYCPQAEGSPPGSRAEQCASAGEYLAITAADGSGFREYSTLRWPSFGCWSRGNSRLALSAQIVGANEGDGDGLWVLDVKSGAIQGLMPGESAHVASQCWSPDGTEVVYTFNQSPGFQIVRIYNTALGQSRDLARGGWATWSPDGAWIAFLDRPSSPRAQSTYYVLRPSGGSEKRALLRTEIGADALWWSADSRFVAYVGCGDAARVRSCNEMGLWVRRVEDGAEDRLATVADTDVPWFQWVQNPGLVKQ